MVVNVAIFGAFLLIVSVLGFFLWKTLLASEEHGGSGEQSAISQSHEKPKAKDALGSSPSPKAHNPTEEAIAEYTKWLAIFTLFLVLATIGLFISGERNVEVASRSASAAREAADATRASVNLAESNSERQLRAYIFPSEIKVLNVVEGQPPRFELLVKNTGLTPATEVIAWAGIGVLNFPLDRALTQATPDFMKTASRRVVGPGGAFVMRQAWSSPLTAQHMGMLKAGKAAVFVWGEITYLDAFNKKRTSKILSYYGGDTGLPDDGFTTTAPDGNDAN